MQFFSAAASLCLASMAMAAPALEARQGATAVGTINATLNALAPTLPSYEVAVENAVATIYYNVGAQGAVIVAAEGIIYANLGAIVSGLNDSANAIIAVTTGAAGGVAAAAKTFVQSEIDQLQEDVLIVRNIIAGLNATIVTAVSLEASVVAFYGAELQALENVLKPFIDPVLILASAAVSVSTGVTVSGLAGVTVGVESIANNFYQSLGLPTTSYSTSF